MRFPALLSIVAALALASPSMAQSVTPVPAPCKIATTSTAKTDYSTTLGNSSTVIIPAAPKGITRTGIFIQLLTGSASIAINPSGGTASLTTAGNMVCNTQYCGFNFASMGFMPQGAITGIADSSSRAVTILVCPG